MLRPFGGQLLFVCINEGEEIDKRIYSAALGVKLAILQSQVRK